MLAGIDEGKCIDDLPYFEWKFCEERRLQLLGISLVEQGDGRKLFPGAFSSVRQGTAKERHDGLEIDVLYLTAVGISSDELKYEWRGDSGVQNVIFCRHDMKIAHFSWVPVYFRQRRAVGALT